MSGQPRHHGPDTPPAFPSVVIATGIFLFAVFVAGVTFFLEIV